MSTPRDADLDDMTLDAKSLEIGVRVAEYRAKRLASEGDLEGAAMAWEQCSKLRILASDAFAKIRRRGFYVVKSGQLSNQVPSD